MATVITFDDLSVGDAVSNQFTNAYGITFKSPLGKISWDPQSPFAYVLDAALAGPPEDFSAWSISGTFTDPTHSRFGVTINQGVMITFRDKANNVIATHGAGPLKFKDSGSGAYVYSEYATGKANIASFEMKAVLAGPFSLASISFDTIGILTPHKPDFRILYAGAAAPEKAGESGSISVTIARLYNSKGPIKLVLSTIPGGIFNPASVTFDKGDGNTATIKMVAKLAIKQDDIMTITGTPSSSTAGYASRMMNVAYFPTIGLPLPPP